MISDGTGDMQVVSGVENMSAAVQDRLRTDRGELIKHPEYGLNLASMIGEPGDKNYLTLARLELQSTLLQDSRIVKVDNLTLVKSQETLNADMNLMLVDETTRPTSADVPI
jgi:phage baseplate assembly protein W